MAKKDIIPLEKVDEALLRGLLQAHSKIPLEALYMETKSIPIRYIVASRRIMYLHNILQKDEKEMVRRVYEAQKADPSQGDFTELVTNDCEAIELGMSDVEIRRMSKFKFKKVVTSKVLKAAFKYLKDLQKTHSKMDNLQYDKFEASIFLTSP